MSIQNKPNLRALGLVALALGVGMFLALSLWRVPTRVSAERAAQATAQATANATVAPTVAPTIDASTVATYTNACGTIISNNPVTPTVEVTETEAAPTPTTAPTATNTPTTNVSPTVRVLRIGEDTYPDVLDPQRAYFVNEFEVLNLAYEGLVSVNPAGEIEPAAASKYEFSADGKQLTFTIRPGLKRVDDTPITSKDFAAAIKRGLDPCLGGRQYATVLYAIQGAQALSEFDIDNSTAADLKAAQDAVGVATPDDSTLVLTFTEPVGTGFLFQTSLPIFFPTDPHSVATSPDGWSEIAGDHNGNGPYIILNLDKENAVTLIANPNYWQGSPKIDRIEFTYNPDNQAQLDAYNNGLLDIDAAVTAELVPQIMSSTIQAELMDYNSAQTYALAFNNSVKPFDDRIVRTAFSQALDREGFVHDVLLDTGNPTTRWIPAGVPGNQADTPGVPASDPVAAVKTLVDNGYGTADGKVDCAKLGPIKFTYPDSPVNQKRVEYIAKNLQTVIGCPITPDPVGAIAFTQLVRDVKTNPQLSLQRWVEDFPHPENWLSTYWSCGGSAQRYGYCNVYLDDLLNKADSTTDLEAAIKLYQQAEDLLITDVPGAFMYNPENLHLVKPYVVGPQDNISPRDAGWAGEHGPVWQYDINLSTVPPTYPRQ